MAMAMVMVVSETLDLYLIKDDPFNISNHIGTPIQHRTQDFGGHNETIGIRIHLN